MNTKTNSKVIYAPEKGRLEASKRPMHGALIAVVVFSGGLLPSLADEPTIGPADGVTYEITSTSQVYDPAPECGFNDLGVPILGEYMKETRRYHQWSHGTEERAWDETTTTFKDCKGP
jgi:hypothetical protein